MNCPFHLFREEVIRVGKCNCSESQKSSGSMHGRKITLPAPPGKRLRPKLRFRIEEYPIPEGSKEAYWIDRYRCHFFRDTHLWRWSPPTLNESPYRVFLNICAVEPWGTVSVGAVRESYDFRRNGNKVWALDEPLDVEVMLESIIGALSSIPENGRRRWLREMTPRGWKPPDILSDE